MEKEVTSLESRESGRAIGRTASPDEGPATGRTAALQAPAPTRGQEAAGATAAQRSVQSVHPGHPDVQQAHSWPHPAASATASSPSEAVATTVMSGWASRKKRKPGGASPSLPTRHRDPRPHPQHPHRRRRATSLSAGDWTNY